MVVKKKKYLLVDVETIGTEVKLIYDLAYIITDKKGHIYKKRGFLIEGVFDNMDIMSKAYYFKNYSKYFQLVQNGDYAMSNFADVLAQMKSDIEEYEVDVITAYNSWFDMSSIDYTCKHFKVGRPEFFGMPIECVWSYAVNVLMDRWSYRSFARRHGLLTEKKGHYSSNAENCYKYLSWNLGFEEQHIGLFDAIIEVQILAYCNRQCKRNSHARVQKNVWENMAIGKDVDYKFV